MGVGVAVAAVGLVIWLAVRAQRARCLSDGEWGVLVACSQCGTTVPRWFLLDRGTARGPISRYPYPLPTACRICRHEKGLRPIPWHEGETEAVYDERSEKAAAERIARAMR